MLNINVNYYYPMAEKAVKSYANTVFTKFFSEEDLEDLTSEVVKRMLESGDRYNEQLGSVSTWIGTIAKHLVLDAVKKEKRRRDLYSSKPLIERIDKDSDVLGFVPVACDETDATVIAKDTEQILLDSILSSRDQRLFNDLKQGYTTSEIAAMEGGTIGSIYTAVSRLRKQLRSVS